MEKRCRNGDGTGFMGLGDEYNGNTTISEVPATAPSTHTNWHRHNRYNSQCTVLLPGFARVL